MKKLGVFLFCFLVCAASLTLLVPAAAEASGWEWRQNDWSGGPGQGIWLDDARYSASHFMDTTSVPGTMRTTYMIDYMTKEAANPVIAPGALVDWDASFVTGRPVRSEGGGYETLYRGVDVAGFSALGYASSGNGVNWTKFPGNPVLERSGPAPAWDQNGVDLGPILKEGDTYSMFFRGYDATFAIRYGLATSTDLMTWQRTNDFVFGPGAGGSWEANLDEIIVKLMGSGYGMWYLAYDAGGSEQIGYATSPDGVSWSRSAANPVLPKGGAGDWDAGGIQSFQLLERPWLGDYMMAYSGHDLVGNSGIGIATSTDGITWVKDLANPVMVEGGAPWYQTNIEVSDIVFDGTIYKMVLSGTGMLGVSAGQTYSQDGSAWNIVLSPFIGTSAAPAWDDSVIRTTYPTLSGNTLRGFYNAFGSGAPGSGIGTATTTPNYAGGGAWLESSVFDAGSQVQWGNVTWDEVVPPGGVVAMRVRTGDVPIPDGTWSAWTAVANGAPVPGGPTRYAQYRVDMAGGAPDSPVVSNIAIDLTAIPSVWYFAEGYTGAGFDEYITIQNPGPTDANVAVTYYTPSGPPQVRPHHVPANSRYTIYVNHDLGAGQENSFMVASDEPVICERPMYFRYAGTAGHNWRGGSDAMGSTQLSRQWYFAEGYTGPEFEEYLTIQNPGVAWATVNVTYFVNGGDPIQKQHRVAPASRYTIMVNDDAGPDLEVSAMLEADQPILAERPMYFNFAGSMDGGHIVMGSPWLARDWYLAEGATFDPYTEFITIQNPNPAPATVAIEYYTPAGVPIPSNRTIAANSRYTINVGTDSGVDAEVSTYLHSNLPILVERPMYFDMLYGGLPGGHCAVGVNSPSPEWYFAEGYTGTGFDEYLTVQNPGAAAANLLITYFVNDGLPITSNHTVQPHSRLTLNVGDDAGQGLEVSTYVLSDAPVICERPMYFFYQGTHAYNWPGGHDSQGFAP
jgi:P pilus assembly chaperone PapD